MEDYFRRFIFVRNFVIEFSQERVSINTQTADRKEYTLLII